MTFLITFIVLSTINVVFSTVRTLLTVKGGKVVASLLNGGYFAFYNVMIIYTVADFPLWQKCLITFFCNVVGVFVVKCIEEKMQKAKLWKVTITVPLTKMDTTKDLLNGISFTGVYTEQYAIFDCYCETKAQTKKCVDVAKACEGKYCATESKLWG